VKKTAREMSTFSVDGGTFLSRKAAPFICE
jgi:hypothetical protein